MLDSYKHAAIFVKIVEVGSLTAAAHELGVTRSSISQQLAELERGLGVKLLHRTTRSQALTEAGERFLEPAKAMVLAMEEADAAARGVSGDLSGRLRVTAPHDLTDLLAHKIAAFRELYPELEVELLFDDHRLNLETEKIDVSIRTGWLTDSSWHATQLMMTEPWLCVRTDLIEELPETPEDLLHLPWIILTILDSPYRWRFRHRVRGDFNIKVKPGIETNSPAAVKDLVVAGAGVGVCLSYQVALEVEDEVVTRLLPDYFLRPAGMYAVQPYGRRAPAKVVQFIRFLKEELGSL